MSDTRSTPETDAARAEQARVTGGQDTHLIHYRVAERLERERDEAREEIARMQTMAASVADVLAKRDAMLEVIRWAHDALSTSLRQWVLYADERADEDLESAKHTEGQLYRLGQSTLDKLKPFLP